MRVSVRALRPRVNPRRVRAPSGAGRHLGAMSVTAVPGTDAAGGEKCPPRLRTRSSTARRPGRRRIGTRSSRSPSCASTRTASRRAGSRGSSVPRVRSRPRRPRSTGSPTTTSRPRRPSSEIAPELLELLAGAVFVAHNADFDLPCCRRAFAAHRHRLPPRWSGMHACRLPAARAIRREYQLALALPPPRNRLGGRPRSSGRRARRRGAAAPAARRRARARDDASSTARRSYACALAATLGPPRSPRSAESSASRARPVLLTMDGVVDRAQVVTLVRRMPARPMSIRCRASRCRTCSTPSTG